MAVDTKDLKQRIDLRSLIEGFTELAGGPREFFGGCPKCGGTDRFHFNSDKGWFCRKCTGDPTEGGWHDAIDFIMLVHGVNFVRAYEMLSGGDLPQLSPEAVAAREAARAEEDAADEEHRAQLRAELNASGAWQEYHRNVDKMQAGYLWHERGLSDRWIDYFGLGFSVSRKFYYQQGGEKLFFEGASITIPTFRVKVVNDAPVLSCVALAHRLLAKDAPCGKYRPHMAGVGKSLYITNLWDEEITGPVLLVEGEIKAAVTYARIQDYCDAQAELGQNTGLLPFLQVVGTAGAGFKRESAAELAKASEVWVLFDPDAAAAARTAAATIGTSRSRIVDLPGKIDDMLKEGSLSVEDIPSLLENARRL